jgi:hypothetical protein
MTMGLPCDREGYDLRMRQCSQCGSRGCPKRDTCKPRRMSRGAYSYTGDGPRYIVVELGDGSAADVIHIGPYTVSKGLKVVEAIALAKALNEENKGK